MPTATPRAVHDDAEQPSDRRSAGISCRGCDTRIPIRLSKSGESPALWECVRCGARFAGVLLASDQREQLSRLRLADVHFDTCQLPPIPKSLRELAVSFHDSQLLYQGLEQRGEVRLPRSLDAVVTSLNSYFTPRGWAFPAIVHNISETGLAFVGAHLPDGPHVAILIPRTDAPPLQMFGCVARAQILPDGFHEVGIRFEYRLGSQHDS